MDKENNAESELPQKYEKKSYKSSRRSFYLNKKKNQEIQENKIENPEPKKEEEKIKVVKKIIKKDKKPYVHHSYPKLNQKKLSLEEIITNNDILQIKKYNSSKKVINIETLQNKIFTSKNKNKKNYKFNNTNEKEEKLNKSKSAKTIQVKTNNSNINIDKNSDDIKEEKKITVNTKQSNTNIPTTNSNKPNETNKIKIENKNYRINTNKPQNNSNTKPINTTNTNNPQKSTTKSNPYTKTNINITSTKTNVTKNVVEVKKNKTQQKMDMLKSQGKSLLLGAPKKECPLCHKYVETHLLKIHMNIHLSQILHWLYLGNFENACDIKELRRNNIGYVLNCAIECKNKVLPKSIVELHLDVRDEPEFDIIKYFDKSNAFINKVRTDGGNILVHCKMGLSRSPTFIIAFLIKYYGFTVDSAINYLKRKRPYVNINHGFIEQLHQYESTFKKKSEK
jgi:protein-tyrosine phosphatase